jgi:hypothetical protein
MVLREVECILLKKWVMRFSRLRIFESGMDLRSISI